MEFYDFPETVGIVIIPTDFHSIIFQRGRAQPATRFSKALSMKIFRYESSISQLVDYRML